MFPLAEYGRAKAREHEQNRYRNKHASISQPININVLENLNHINQSAQQGQ
jgi:hypothetical protein